MIENRAFRIKKSEITNTQSLLEIIENIIGDNVLRWYIARIDENDFIVEATLSQRKLDSGNGRLNEKFYPGKSVVLNIIPTGIGCSIGGYAGDAAPVTNLLASTVDYLITNTNSVNASNFIGLANENILYTDGYTGDIFSKGLVDLYLPCSNKIGLVIEKSEGWKLDIVFNIVNAVRAIHGVNISNWIVTDKPIGGRCVENNSGAIVGTIDNPQVLLESCEKLIRKGVDAIAITSNVQDLTQANYAKHFSGEYPNPVGGVEAIISYLIANQFRIPVAHAPLLTPNKLDLKNNIVDARGAGEFASTSGLACILVGLQKSPQTRPRAACAVSDIININNLLAVVTPASCLGGVPILYAQKHGVPVIAVQENQTILDVTQSKMNLDNLIEVRNYPEAAGIILALKRGIGLESLSRPLKTLSY